MDKITREEVIKTVTYYRKKDGSMVDIDGYETVIERGSSDAFAKREKKRKEIIEKKRYEKNDTEKFFWYIYDSNNTALSNLKTSHIAMLMYLCTFMNYDNYLKANSKTYITRKDFEYLLKIKRAESYNFYNALVDNNIITVEKAEKETRLKVNVNIFYKGKFNKNKVDAKIFSAIRIYNSVIQKLYNSEHSKNKIGYMYKLITVSHETTNILCTNKFEIDVSKIKKISRIELSNIFNYSISNISKLIEELSNITFTHNGYEQQLLKKFNGDLGLVYAVNPLMFYAGTVKDRINISNKFVIQQ